MTQVPILNKQQADAAVPGVGLPSAGYKRDEVLIQRDDTLQQAAEELATKKGVHQIDPAALQPDREILREIYAGGLNVSGALGYYRYCWVFSGKQGLMVWAKKSLSKPYFPWEVVQGDMPEAKEYIFEDTTRRIGDTILMRLRLDCALVNDANDAKKRQRQQFGVTAELEDLAHKHRGKGITVHTDIDAVSASGHRIFPKSTPAVGVARTAIDKMLKEGTVPGMQVRDH